jgi:hypothetical protein
MPKDNYIIPSKPGFVLDSVESFNLLQYEQASSAYREQLGHLIKLVVMFMTINVALTGFGFRFEEPFAFLLAGVTGFTLICIIRAIYRLTIPALCIGIELEDRAREAEGHPLNNQIVSTMVLQELGLDYLSSLRDVASERDLTKRAVKLKALRIPYIGPKVRLLCSALAVVSSLQVLVFVSLMIFNPPPLPFSKSDETQAANTSAMASPIPF